MHESPRPLPTRRERRRHKKHVTVAWATVTAVALVTAVSAASIPAAYAVADASAPSPIPSASVPAADTMRVIVADARAALADADTAKADAAALTAEIANAGLDLGLDDTSIDLSDLASKASRLDAIDLRNVLPGSAMIVPVLTDEVDQETRSVTTRTAVLRERLDAARADKAAADAATAAAAAAAEAQRQADEAAAALAAANTVDGAKATARELAASMYGWGGEQFSCLESLWQKESGWNYLAYNDSSGATGIAQALPGDKMASAGEDWLTSARTQIIWGLGYIDGSYGSPCAAWGHSQATDWY